MAKGAGLLLLLLVLGVLKTQAPSLSFLSFAGLLCLERKFTRVRELRSSHVVNYLICHIHNHQLIDQTSDFADLAKLCRRSFSFLLFVRGDGGFSTAASIKEREREERGTLCPSHQQVLLLLLPLSHSLPSPFLVTYD